MIPEEEEILSQQLAVHSPQSPSNQHTPQPKPPIQTTTPNQTCPRPPPPLPQAATSSSKLPAATTPTPPTPTTRRPTRAATRTRGAATTSPAATTGPTPTTDTTTTANTTTTPRTHSCTTPAKARRSSETSSSSCPCGECEGMGAMQFQKRGVM
ncbi:hypothetical protein BZA05DRAFT_388986 [Tricharina praecox]|uniref:uncharacterized protein n=1 Tax=Tricharina praecox TaxID=43433 RepID=UPI00221EB1E3|nr:uncharacterized protein BZA05DRAFT_388986 [Tricharina praecox]KAI5856561.1 hypothetical protein BZA05DRAFT_388986 [Tricharina praecox]